MLYSGKITDGRDIFFEESTSDTFFQFPDTLDAEYDDYSWMISAYDPSDQENGCMGATWWFATGTGFNNPPVPAFDPFPEDNITGVNTNPLLEWNCYDPDGDILTYDVWLETASGGRVLVGDDLSTKTCDPGVLELGVTYYWQVTASDPNGGSTEGNIWIFSTSESFAPNSPSGPVPDDDSTGVSLPVQLQWTCSDPDGDPLVYDVHMRKVGEPLVMIGHGISDSFIDVPGLEHETEYEWQVTAEDDDGNRTSGTVWSFITEAPTAYPGIYAELMIHRNQYISDGIPPDPDEMIRLDHVYARFDSVYAPDGPVYPRQPAAVSYNVGGDVHLSWVEASSRYYQDNPYNGWFLAPGYDYIFTVTPGDDVPALTKSIYYPECRPFLNSPDAFSSVSKDGFTVTWSGHDMYTDCPAEIRIRIMDMGPMTWTDVDMMVPNTGSYTFDDLSGLDPMVYQIQVVLIMETKEYINTPGYDPRSWAWARTHSMLFLYLN